MEWIKHRKQALQYLEIQFHVASTITKNYIIEDFHLQTY